jgi:hypothetical protein
MWLKQNTLTSETRFVLKTVGENVCDISPSNFMWNLLYSGRDFGTNEDEDANHSFNNSNVKLFSIPVSVENSIISHRLSIWKKGT